MNFSSQDIAQLVEQRSGRIDDVMADAVLQSSLQTPRATKAAMRTFVSRSSVTRRG